MTVKTSSENLTLHDFLSSVLNNIIPSHFVGTMCSNYLGIDHFTVSCLVAWPLNESEAGGDLVLIETSLLFSG